MLSSHMHPGTAATPPPASAEATGPRSRYLGALLMLALIAFPCVVLYRAVGPAQLLSSLAWSSPSPRSSGAPPLHRLDEGGQQIGLEKVLRRAAMVDKTVILTTLNAAWASPDSVIDLFLESFRIGERTSRLLEHLVIVAMDGKAYARCKSIHPHCYALTTEGVDFSGEKVFMTGGYLKMMWRRLDFLRMVLELGYDFIFSDADIMWFRDPLPHFHPDADFQIACDHFVGNSNDLRNSPNGGFMYVMSNNRTIEFYKFWYFSRGKHPGYNEQDVLNFIKHDQFLRKIGLSMRFLDTANFGGLCEPSRDLNKVCTMHANCCIGLHRKLHDLRVMLEDWRMYLSRPPSVKGPRASWRVPQNCSLAPLG